MSIVIGFLTFLHVLTCILLITAVLLQAAKGGGLSGTFGGTTTSTLFGPRGTASALSTVTQYLAAVFMVLSLSLSLLAGTGRRVESVTQKVLESTPASQLPPVEALDFGAGAAPTGETPTEENMPAETP